MDPVIQARIEKIELELHLLKEDLRKHDTGDKLQTSLTLADFYGSVPAARNFSQEEIDDMKYAFDDCWVDSKTP